MTNERHMSLSVGGGQAGQGYPCVLVVKEVLGVDAYNLCGTGGVAKTMTSGRNDKNNIPCVLVVTSESDGHDSRPSDSED